MLRDEIERVRKSNPGNLVTRTCACKCCGQMTNLDLPSEWSNAFCDEAATEFCDCYDSKVYTQKKKQKERAIKAVEEQFGENAGKNKVDEEVKELLLIIIDQVVENRISSGSVDIGCGLKAKISITSKGAVKVERSRTEKTTKEA